MTDALIRIKLAISLGLKIMSMTNSKFVTAMLAKIKEVSNKSMFFQWFYRCGTFLTAEHFNLLSFYILCSNNIK